MLLNALELLGTVVVYGLIGLVMLVLLIIMFAAFKVVKEKM